MADEIPQKNPKINRVIYKTCRSKENDCAIMAKAMSISTKIIAFFYPIKLTTFADIKDPDLGKNYPLWHPEEAM